MISFYVCSRLFVFSPSRGPNRQGAGQKLAGNVCLAAGVLDMTDNDPELDDQTFGISPAKDPQPGLPLARQPVRGYPRQVN